MTVAVVGLTDAQAHEKPCCAMRKHVVHAQGPAAVLAVVGRRLMWLSRCKGVPKSLIKAAGLLGEPRSVRTSTWSLGACTCLRLLA